MAELAAFSNAHPHNTIFYRRMAVETGKAFDRATAESACEPNVGIL